MTKFCDFLKIWGVIVFLTTCTFSSFSQVVYNNGLDIYAKQGAIFFVDGTVQNQTGIIEVEENTGNNAEMIIQQDFINNATAGGDGYYRVLGNWINNNIFNAGSGTVFLEGGNQFIDGSVSTFFNNLTLDGSGLKTQTIDQYCTGILDLKHLELQNEVFGFYVENTNVNSVIRTTGFVSGLDGGFLSRNTNSSAVYLYPVGSSLITTRYRPVEITPENANANTYTVRMANVLATTEGYDINALPPKICEVNPEFYHQVNQTVGTSPIELDIFFDEIADGSWDGLANWTAPPDLWDIILTSVITPGVPFNEAIIGSWNNFIEIPYILYRIQPDAAITDPGDFCNNDASLNLSAADIGGTWTGTGITDGVNGTFDPGTAGAGIHTITYDIGSGSCTDTNQIDITVFAIPDATITDPGAFCDNDVSINLSAVDAGGTWTGTGITDGVNGTFDPATAGAGTHTITYDVGIGSCTDTDQFDITVNATPNATITDPGDFCNTDLATNLSAATAGGTWSGTGITDGALGTFDPTAANIGGNTITYDLTVSGCTSSSNLSIDVYDTPDATITDPGVFCDNDATINLSAVDAGGTWTGTGITDGVNGTFDPATAGAGTHTITYDVGTGSCTDTDQFDITVNATPNATITDPGDFCNTDGTINLTAATAGGTWSGTGITDGVLGTFDPTTANIGGNTITYDLTVSGCTSSNNLSIDVYDTPDATITDPGVFCDNDVSINLSAVDAGGTWTGTGITDGVNGTFDPATAGAGTHTITYDVGTGSCTDTDQFDITVNATPNATITDPGDFCNTDGTINLTAATAGGTWSGTGITDGILGTFDPSIANIGGNTITYDLTVSGCTSSNNLSIDVYDTPDASITDPGAFCDNDVSINLSAVDAGGTWTGTGITDGVNGTFDPATAGAGTHTITYDVGTGSCSDTDQFDITVNATPNATITDPGDFCNTDLATNLSAATAGGTWSGTGITDGALGTFDPTAANIGGNTITYDLTVSGCTSSNNLSIDVYDTPDATITDPGDFCDNDASLNLSAVDAGGTWTGTGITDGVNGTFDPATAGAGTHTITYDVGTGSCSDTDQFDITVNATPNATITDPGDFCNTDGTINLTAATAGGTWSGTGITDGALGTFDPSIANVGGNTITYDLTVSGCTSSNNLSIDVYDTPDATITDPGDFCDNDASLNLSAVDAGGTWTGTGITDGVNGTFDPATAGAGTHTITYDVGTGTCADTDQFDITVNATPNATITDPGDFCDTDDSVNLSATPSGGDWSGSGITDSENGIFDPYEAGEGTFTITYSITENGCIGGDQININVYTSPDVTIDQVGPFCNAYNIIQLTAETEGGTWVGSGTSSNGQFNIAEAGVGVHQIAYTFSGSCGAIGTTEIEVYPSDIHANYVVENPICQGGLSGGIDFSVIGGTPPYTFEWGNGGYSESIHLNSLASGIYFVTIIDINGCSSEVGEIIILDGSDDCVEIPNAFTPNADGINDHWVITNLDSFDQYLVQVFNRWGQELYYGLPGSEPWDGTWNGKILPTGGYLYVVQIDEIREKFVGVVTLIR